MYSHSQWSTLIYYIFVCIYVYLYIYVVKAPQEPLSPITKRPLSGTRGHNYYPVHIDDDKDEIETKANDGDDDSREHSPINGPSGIGRIIDTDTHEGMLHC